jgi:diguanylate cyclase (GGDEF)-like protein
VSSRLLGVLRVDDVVARLGGDEFTVLITNGFDAIAAEAVAHQIVDLVGSPYFVQGETVEVRASLGLARYPEHGATVEELLAAADRAMYLAKNAGGNTVRLAAADQAA